MSRVKKHARIKISQIRELSRIQATEAEAAGVLGIQLKTFKEALRIDVKAREAWESGRADGKVSIRRKQFRLADSNATMAIFLGKQYLGQNETQVIQHTGAEGGPIKTLDLGKLTPTERMAMRDAIVKARK